MSSRKKSTSSTESSSDSTSGSSSSSGSSSETDSNSSSSDSDSSSSRAADRNSSSTSIDKNKANAQPTTAPTAPTKKLLNRQVSDTKDGTNKSGGNEKQNSTSTSATNKAKAIAAATKAQHQKHKSVAPVHTAEDDGNPGSKTTTGPVKKHLPDGRKKSTHTNNPTNNRTSLQPTIGQQNLTSPPVGGKAPPAIVKQQQQLHSSQMKNILNNKNAAAAAAAAAAAHSKVVPSNKSFGSFSTNQKKSGTEITTTFPSAAVASKKKSIFSSDNSSDSGSGDEDDDGKVKTSGGNKPSVNNQSKSKKNGSKKGRPPNKTKPTQKPMAQSSDSSGSTSSSDSSSSSSDSESTDYSTPPSKRPTKNQPNQQKHSPTKSEIHDDGNSESDLDGNKQNLKNVSARKLTRSSSARKSKHLTGKASETESETESKRSISKSPVKRAVVTSLTLGAGTGTPSTITTTATTTKGKSKSSSKNSTTPSKKVQQQFVPEERKCSVIGCDSKGHLGGRLETHFTQEACPIYHNMTLADAKAWALERNQRNEERKKALILYDPDKKQPTFEQRAYQLKVKDIRTKFKPNPCSPIRNPATNSLSVDKTREPSVTGLVSDYDLQMFREAQAIASERMESEFKDLPVGKGTKYIIMGRHKMEVWYQSPYPDDAARLPKLYLCEFCLRYQKSETGMKRHAAKCVWRHPPGDEIYRKGKLCVWQVDGKRHKQYCQHLCLLAKFFLDHKTLYYDVEPFLFYIMTLADSEGCHTVGYFSKEKNSFLNYNVSCILTLPPYQRKGFGRLLIDFSYLLTRVEGKIGSPEKPLSDLGLISYRSYWKDVLLDYLCTRTGITLSIKDVSQEMAINSYDIVSTLQALGMMKYWKGKHIILKKQDVLEEYVERVKRRGAVLKIDPTCLRWTPFIPPTPPGPSS